MSSQKGNVNRTRPQKYKNRTSFRNNLHDTSKKIKDLNNLEVAEVCKQCKDVIEWKIKYKKYKPLTQPKTCVQCHQKSVKHAYHTLCDPCGKALKSCCKCQKMKDVIHGSIQMKPKEEVIAMMRKDLKLLPERKRRTFYRYLDVLYGTDKKKRKGEEYNDEEEEEKEESIHISEEEQEILEDPKKLEITPDYLKKIRAKLEELGQGLLTDDLEEDSGNRSDESEVSAG